MRQKLLISNGIVFTIALCILAAWPRQARADHDEYLVNVGDLRAAAAALHDASHELVDAVHDLYDHRDLHTDERLRAIERLSDRAHQFSTAVNAQPLPAVRDDYSALRYA